MYQDQSPRFDIIIYLGGIFTGIFDKFIEIWSVGIDLCAEDSYKRTQGDKFDMSVVFEKYHIKPLLLNLVYAITHSSLRVQTSAAEG